MDRQSKIEYLWSKTSELDPDYVVGVLGLTTHEIMDAFKERMLDFIEDDYEDFLQADEEGDYD